VVGTQAVLDAVHRCWASLWTGRAVSYRAVNGIDHATVELAVVVQRMVDASPGLGEAVVSGAVNPDRFVVDTQTDRIVERRLADKRLAARALPGGGTEQVVTSDGSASLSDTQLLRLVALGDRVESHYHAPQDLEWAIDGADATWLTQARPITTLVPLPEPAATRDDGSPVRVYFCFSLALGLHRPISPMGLSALHVVPMLDIGLPRWRDDPSRLLGVLANYLRLPPDAMDPESEFRRGAAQADAMIVTLQSRARLRGRARGAAVGFSLRRTRQLAGLREMPKYLLVLALAGARSELAKIGQDLASTGRLAAAEDVFFLDLHEVRAALDGADQRAQVRRGRQTYDQEMRRRHLPRLLLSDGTEPEAASTPAADGVLHGSPASAGTVTAAARVVLDPAGAHLLPGEILVVPSTDPGWTPLFLTAGGLVMEMGRANSHGAVVAREYGIPAVVGVPDATTRITTGAQVRLDGTNGVVVPL